MLANLTLVLGSRANFQSKTIQRKAEGLSDNLLVLNSMVKQTLQCYKTVMKYSL